jgi:CheY-like chemotaxis protein
MAPPYRILIVDDNHLIRRLLSLILEGAGYVPAEADSGDMALTSVRVDPPDACIVDEVMPGMHGSELIRAIRRSHAGRAAGGSAARRAARRSCRRSSPSRGPR